MVSLWTLCDLIMNERIKELWNYAADTTKDDSWESQSAFIEEFAELIIRECCQFEKSYSGDAGLVARHFSRKIKEHFGVEE